MIGAGVFVALIAGAIAPTLSMLVRLTKDRRVDALAVAVLGVLLLSAGVSLIDGSPQFLAAKDCVLTAAWGGWFFLSLHGPDLPVLPTIAGRPQGLRLPTKKMGLGQRGVMGPGVAAVAAFSAHLD